MVGPSLVGIKLTKNPGAIIMGGTSGEEIRIGIGTDKSKLRGPISRGLNLEFGLNLELLDRYRDSFLLVAGG